MKQLIWIVVLFALAIGLALASKTYSGNVFITVENYMLRINLHLFILALIALVVLLYVAVRLLAGILSAPERMGAFGSRRRNRQAAEALNAAGLAYFEGKYQEAAQAAAKVLANKEAGSRRILALMIGAHAADQSGDQETRNRYLADIAKLPEKQQLSRYLLLAESALAAGDWAAADSHLKAAAQINPRLTRLVRLQQHLAVERGDALDMLDKTDKLVHAGALGNNEALRQSRLAYSKLLDLAQDATGLKAALKRIPDEFKHGAMSAEIAGKYEALGLYSQAVAWVNKHYPQSRDAALLPHFVNSVRYLDGHEQRKAIDTADAWLRDNPNDARLLLHLGELAYEQQLWGKAQGYLEASLTLQNSSEARLALAKVFDATNQTQLAAEQRRLVLDSIGETE